MQQLTVSADRFLQKEKLDRSPLWDVNKQTVYVKIQQCWLQWICMGFHMWIILVEMLNFLQVKYSCMFIGIVVNPVTKSSWPWLALRDIWKEKKEGRILIIYPIPRIWNPSRRSAFCIRAPSPGLHLSEWHYNVTKTEIEVKGQTHSKFLNKVFFFVDVSVTVRQ